MSLLTVAEALARILAAAPAPTEAERVQLQDGLHRTLAGDLAALRSQPPFDASAMDGYAVRAADLDPAPARLRVIGESAAGHGFSGRVGPGEAVRIFTGAPLPDGADTILIQENADRDGDHVVARQSEPRGRFVREAGYDFRQGDVLLKAGLRLGTRHLALAAAMNHPELAVRRRPRVALLATGDELVRPGEALGADQIVTSNNFAIAGIAAETGAEPIDLGIAGDTPDALEHGLAQARAARADIFVTLGGASVGDHDLVQRVLQPKGLSLDFWKIAMRPGKPLMFGKIAPMLFLGLPGNPVSAIVCAHLFLRPLIRKLLGDLRAGEIATEAARLGRDLPENDERQDYLRATLTSEGDALVATPFPRQDSGMVAMLAGADALVVREPHARAARAGDTCRIIRL
jgi:molybdopterin molybdotransferase